MNQKPFVLLDLDDTILDLGFSKVAEAVFQASRPLREKYALDPVALSESFRRASDAVWSDVERAREGRRDLLATSASIIGAAAGALGVVIKSSEAATFAEQYRSLRDAAVAPYPGAIETLERLRSVGVRLALLTNGSSSAQRAKIDRFDLAHHFDVILIEGEFGHGKPDERVFAEALNALGALPDQTVMVGDDLELDVRGASAVGIETVWIDITGAGLPLAALVKPGRTIRTLAEL